MPDHKIERTDKSSLFNQGNAYALLIGIDQYEPIRTRLRFATKDAKAVRDLLIDPQQCGYPADGYGCAPDCGYQCERIGPPWVHKKRGVASSF